MKKKILSVFFLLHSSISLAMDVEEFPDSSVCSQAPVAQEQNFISHIPEEIQLYVLLQLPLADFYAFIAICKKLYAFAHDRRLCLEQEPAALIQQLQEFIAPDGTVNLQALLPMTIRTRDADVLLYEAGQTSLPAQQHFLASLDINESFKPYFLALYLAQNLGNVSARRTRYRLANANQAFFSDQGKDVWKYFFPSVPKRHFEPDPSRQFLVDIVSHNPYDSIHMPSYRMICDMIDFGYAWHLSHKARFKNFIQKNTGCLSSFDQMYGDLSNILNLRPPSGLSSESKKIWFFFHDRHMQTQERQIDVLLDAWKKTQEKIKTFTLHTSSPAETMETLRQEEEMLRQRLTGGIQEFYSYTMMVSENGGKRKECALKAAAFYHKMGDNESAQYWTGQARTYEDHHE